MKVISAGFCKTGTTSMAEALRQLGYVVYDSPEQFINHGEDWARIMVHGATAEDFHRMYENVDAVTDIPACYFWEEIHKAFPDAKIIFSMREDEETWMRSLRKQMDAENKWYFRVFEYLSPTNYRLRQVSQYIVRGIFGCEYRYSFLHRKPLPEILLRMTYRRHNANVLQNAPKDKLLIYSTKDGWKSLCEFLGKEVPDTPYPHKNVGGNAMDEILNEHPIFARIKRETMASVSLVTLLLLYSGYKLATGSNPIAYAKRCSVSLLTSLANAIDK